MKAWELLSDESKWTKEVAARDVNGQPTFSGGDEAVCWCALGAIIHCYACGMRNEYAKALSVAESKFGVKSLSHVNDIMGYDAVLAVLKEADV